MSLPRNHPLKVLRGLMLSENFGDVADEINLLHDFYGIPRPEGDFLDADLGAVELRMEGENR